MRPGWILAAAQIAFAASAQSPHAPDVSAWVTATPPVCARSVVLMHCPDPEPPKLDLVPKDERRERMRGRLQRNADRLEQRAKSDHVDADLGTVIVEGQVEQEERPHLADRFRGPRVRRSTDPVIKTERGQWGKLCDCVIDCSGPACCMCSSGIPAAGLDHWMNAR